MPGNKILVIRGGAVGDFILTLPVLQALRTAFPQTVLSLIAAPQLGDLAKAANLADEIHSIESRALAGFFARKGDLDPVLENLFSSSSIVISYLYDPDEIFQTNVRRCTTAQFIQGPHRPSESEQMHAAEVFLKPLQRLAIFEPDPVPGISLNSTVGNGTMSLARDAGETKILALHPGSGSESKNWPLSSWKMLLDRLVADTDWTFRLIIGEAEFGKKEKLLNGQPMNRFQVLEKESLRQISEKLSKAHLFLGHDSGISHLAAALGLPLLVIWGPSNLNIWRPSSDKLHLIHEEAGIHAISVETVFRKIQQLFG